ncbi:CRISPR-associated protein Cas4 [Picrophilus oshimae]|uniref:DUF83 domain-containing protein n=1 Tax=Picrophilus torridus (strain ATCC 700027 / DSM 9790 / JCM 10055 / NBRC 100828 / KAW 2/3) TaxID=1122961 RepID=Q6L362_PICTO|nr:CRISPR-associated protein Cas4 [Picrophilus oshimae]AAT42589.1 conserved hypothetical protein [Picrophilus oshimae DSM 9789]
MPEYDPDKYRGIDVSYVNICMRRAWLSLHEIFYVRDSYYVSDGAYLADINRKGLPISTGRSRMDNVQIHKDFIMVHEYKRGYKMIKADKMQILHYMYIIKLKENLDIKGKLHFLGSKKVVDIELNDENLNELYKSYENIDKLKDMAKPPEPVRNYFCVHGCSYSDFCWC